MSPIEDSVASALREAPSSKGHALHSPGPQKLSERARIRQPGTLRLAPVIQCDLTLTGATVTDPEPDHSPDVWRGSTAGWSSTCTCVQRRADAGRLTPRQHCPAPLPVNSSQYGPTQGDESWRKPSIFLGFRCRFRGMAKRATTRGRRFSSIESAPLLRSCPRCWSTLTPGGYSRPAEADCLTHLPSFSAARAGCRSRRPPGTARHLP